MKKSELGRRLHGVGAICLSLAAGFAAQPVAADVDAEALYQLRCAGCHGVDGEGTKNKAPALGPALKGNPLVVNAPANVLIGVIRNGRGGQQRAYKKFPNMPMFGVEMVPDVEGLVEYLKTGLQDGGSS
jgi:mono/diheme cytochrome c family protein